MIVGVWAKSDNANSKSEDKCNNGLGNDKEKCYEGDKADSINGNAYGLSKNKFADDVSENNDSVLADEELQQANEEKLAEFEEKHKTIAENFMLIYEVPSEIEIISQEPQYVNGEVVSRIYNLGTKSSARAVGEDNISGYMVMTLNEGDVPIKAYSFNTNYKNLPPQYIKFINLRLYEINKIFESIDSNSSLRGVKKRHSMWDTLLNYTPDKPKPKITSVYLDLNRGKQIKSNNTHKKNNNNKNNSNIQEELVDTTKNNHKTIIENFLEEQGVSLDIVSSETQYVNGEAVGVVYDLGKKNKRYIVGEETLTTTKWEQSEPYNGHSQAKMLEKPIS